MSTVGAQKGSRIERGLLFGACCATLAFAVSLVVASAHPLPVWVHPAGFVLGVLLAALTLLVVARRDRVRDGAWIWVGASFFIFALGSLPDAVGETASSHQQSLIGDIVYLVGFAPLLYGLYQLLAPMTRGAGLLAILDSTIVTAGCFMFAVATLDIALDTAQLSGLNRAVSMNLLDVLGEDMMLALAFGAVHAAHWRPPRWVWWITAAAFVFGSTDALYLVTAAHRQYEFGSALDLGWPISSLALVMAALNRRQGRHERSLPTPDSRMQTAISAALIPAAAALLLLQPGGLLHRVVLGTSLLVITLSAIRLFIAVRQANGMASELRDARIDALTGLPNLRALRALPSRTLEGAVLITLDLDGLGEINARFGNGVGDQVLVVVADRISMCTRDRDLLTRIGGDEFAVVTHNSTPEAAASLAESILAQLEGEIVLEGHTLRVTACAGVSTTLAPDADAEQLITEAQWALHEAKRSGSGIVRMWSGAVGAQSQDRLLLRSEIKQALRGDGAEFVPYFQPIVSLADGSVLAVEALVRWHRDGQVLMPGAFMEEMERSANLTALTAHMLESSLMQLQSAGIQVPVTVNVPPALVDGLLLHVVRGALAESGATPQQLIVEITEDAIMRNPAQAANVLEELRAMGVRVLLDDFGTGWSGLSALRDFAVDGLKLDGSFTRAMHSDPTTNTIVTSVSELASRLGMLVIYEGVEDPVQLDLLATAGEGYVQGFAVEHPIPLRSLERWLRSGDPGFAVQHG